MNRAIIYIAYGKQYLKEVKRSLASIDNQYPAIVCTLNAKEIDGAIPFKLPRRKYANHWFLDRCLYFNHIFESVDYDQLLFLDTDTYICGDLSGWFDILDRVDIASVHAISQQTVFRSDIPASFPEIHGGAFALNRNTITKWLLEKWLDIYKEKPGYWGNDQPPLRQALWEMPHVRFGILPIEYCFRYRWGGLLSRQVVMLHGKEHNTPYEQVAEQVNEFAGNIRIFHRRELA